MNKLYGFPRITDVSGEWMANFTIKIMFLISVRSFYPFFAHGLTLMSKLAGNPPPVLSQIP